MSERRSSRAKKPIKYSGLDDLSDDDFANTTPPPPKKQRAEKSSTKKNATKDKETAVCQTVADVYEPQNSKKRRVPLSDKIYERELQQALEISLIQSQGSPDSEGKKTKISTAITQGGETKDSENSEPSAPAAKHVPGVVVEESIELLGEEVENAKRVVRDRSRSEQKGKQNETPVKSKLKLESDDDDDDYASEGDDDSEDSAEEQESDEDSDFSYSSKSAKKKKTPAKKGKITAKPAKQDSGKAKPCTVPPATKANAPSALAKRPGPSLVPTVSANSTNASPAGTKRPGPPVVPKVLANSAKKTSSVPSRSPAAPSSLTSSWKPPAFSNSSNSNISTVKSPTSGLRLGLSRNQRVKPLHPSVNVT